MSTEGNLNVSADTLLKPGESIKPVVNRNDAIQLIKDHFGYEVSKIKELNSYDDVNYYVEGKKENETEVKKFVFKILNSMDTHKPGHIQAENEIMLLLSSHGVNCSVPQKTVRGEIYSIVSLPLPLDNQKESEATPSKLHLIRLLSFVPGMLFYDADISESLLYEAGAYIAQIEEYLKGFTHQGLENHASLWMMSSVPKLRQFVYVLDDQPDRQKLVLDVLAAFDEKIVPAIPQLEQGVIHGDFNEQNIICQRSEETGKVSVHGIIDFGDCSKGCYLFELAITLCYMMLECVKHGDKIDALVCGGHILAGYSKLRKVPELELDLLKTCIAGRLCQSLVMGLYTYKQDPGNEYLLTTSKPGWRLLERLRQQTSEEQLKNIWAQVLQSYTS